MNAAVYTVRLSRDVVWSYEASVTADGDDIGVTFARGFALTRRAAFRRATWKVDRERRMRESECIVFDVMPSPELPPPPPAPRKRLKPTIETRG